MSYQLLRIHIYKEITIRDLYEHLLLGMRQSALASLDLSQTLLPVTWVVSALWWGFMLGLCAVKWCVLIAPTCFEWFLLCFCVQHVFAWELSSFFSSQREMRGSITFKIVPSYRTQSSSCEVITLTSLPHLLWVLN